MSTPRSLRPPAPGELVAGRYALGDILGAGAMGVVYEATAPGRDAPVALKLLHPELSGDAELRDRFLREASVLGALSHPAFVRVLERGEDGAGRLFLVMERLAGESLRARLGRDRRVGVDAVLPWLSAVADALDEAHGRGIVHGDVKPENLFLLAGGAPPGAKMLDFGMAKVVGLERLTRTGELAGTPAYMPPELIMGASDVDARIDIYGLGMVVFECLAGALPFTERHASRLLLEIVGGRRTPLAALAPDVGARVAAAVDRATAPRAHDRFARASEFAGAVRAAMEAR